MKHYLAMKYRYDKGIEGISEIMYCITTKGGGGLAILPLIIEIEEKNESKRTWVHREGNRATSD